MQLSDAGQGATSDQCGTDDYGAGTPTIVRLEDQHGTEAGSVAYTKTCKVIVHGKASMVGHWRKESLWGSSVTLNRCIFWDFTKPSMALLASDGSVDQAQERMIQHQTNFIMFSGPLSEVCR